MVVKYRDRLTTLIGVVLVVAVLGLLWVTQRQLSDSQSDRRSLVQSVDVLRAQVERLGGTPVVGPAGEPGVAGLTGPRGDQGPAGVEGAAGPAGVPGANGINGVPGPAGSSGAAGTNGSNGVDGASGADGAPGAQGDPGATGPEPQSFTFAFTDAALVTHTYQCADAENDGTYACTETP